MVVAHNSVSIHQLGTIVSVEKGKTSMASSNITIHVGAYWEQEGYGKNLRILPPFFSSTQIFSLVFLSLSPRFHPIPSILVIGWCLRCDVGAFEIQKKRQEKNYWDIEEQSWDFFCSKRWKIFLGMSILLFSNVPRRKLQLNWKK